MDGAQGGPTLGEFLAPGVDAGDVPSLFPRRPFAARSHQRGEKGEQEGFL